MISASRGALRRARRSSRRRRCSRFRPRLRAGGEPHGYGGALLHGYGGALLHLGTALRILLRDGAYSSVCITGALWYVMKKKFAGKGQPAIATVSTSGKSSSKPKKARDVSQKDPTQPKKKNRKRVAERLAAEEAAKNQ